MHKETRERERRGPRPEHDRVAGPNHHQREARDGRLLAGGLLGLLGVARLVAEPGRLDRAAMRANEQAGLGQRAQVTAQRDLGRAQGLSHLGHGDDASRAHALRDHASPLDRKHSPDGTSSIIFDQ